MESLYIFPQADPQPAFFCFIFNSVIDGLAETTDGDDIAFLQFHAFIRNDAAVDKNLFSAEQGFRPGSGQACEGGKNRIQALGGDVQPYRFKAGLQAPGYRR